MHREPFYRWIQKILHRSTAPNLLTTVSERPLDSFINGSFLSLFISEFAVQDATAGDTGTPFARPQNRGRVRVLVQ